MDLQHELARPGLEHRTRLLCIAAAAIPPADWPRFRAAVRLSAGLGLARSEVEELLLQATLFFGFPRVVTAFELLQEEWPAATSPGGGEVPADERRDRGLELFASIYGRNDAAVRAKLGSFHSAFHDFVIEAAYGRVLSRPGLDVRTRELVAVTALTFLDQEPQLVAHARGALRFGAEPLAVAEAMRCGGADGDRLQRLRQRVEKTPSAGS